MTHRILITGGSGYLGRALANKLKKSYEIYLGSRNNKNNFFASKETGCKSIPLDCASYMSVKDVFNEIQPSIVIHAAATKFVDLSEIYPNESIDVNVVGSQNVARAAIDCGVKYVIGISTDKAAPPCKNTYAITKALMERLFCALDKPGQTRFSCVRYGNVAWSTGSVLPAWKEMIDRQSSIQSCGANMYRYLFSVNDAVDVISNALHSADACYGKVLVKDMKSVKIERLLKIVCQECQVDYQLISARQGERNTEYLVGLEELSMASKLSLSGDPYFVINFKDISNNELNKPLSAETAVPLSDDELRVIVNGMKPI